ncbi:WD repeat-containing protein 26 homolog [Cornus florida]|uniref:WD repeat-containing protein 26 homolog n=1 Tax=Cornus florida TaxID=4283 RepID=UPI00289F22D2|nr:WD repeat-containing protein 26 homolog [Cornus florida]
MTGSKRVLSFTHPTSASHHPWFSWVLADQSTDAHTHILRLVGPQILEAHKDEVCILQFSHSGKFLASSSAVIWEEKSTCFLVHSDSPFPPSGYCRSNPIGLQLEWLKGDQPYQLGIFRIKFEVKDNGEVLLKHALNGHQKLVSTISWSPNDSHLLSCGPEEVIILWDVISGECLRVFEKAGVGLIPCGWFPDGKQVVSGLKDKSICSWDLDGKELQCRKGRLIVNKISDMAITHDGKIIMIIYKETAILLFDREAKFERLIQEDEVITSFSLSEDNKFLLVNLVNQEIHLWSIEGDLKSVSKYKGHKRTRFIIGSCFGGFDHLSNHLLPVGVRIHRYGLLFI